MSDMYLWNVVGFELNDEDEYNTKALESIYLTEEGHYDDDEIYNVLVEADLLDANVDIDDLVFDSDENTVYITDNGQPVFSLNRDLRWG